MKLPRMKYASGITRSKQVKFGGMHHALGAGDGELWDMRNLTSDHYPVLATRAPRLKYKSLTQPGGLFAWDGLCWVDGTTFYFDGEAKGQVAAGVKHFAAMGAYIVIFPDKCWYNVETGEFGSMEARWSGGKLTFQDGELYDEPAEANAIYCEGAGWADYFRPGDAVTISGCTTIPDNNMTIVIREISGDKLFFYEHSFILGEDGTAHTEEGELSVARTVPDLKYLCENENRLWGCTGDTIYASKLGDIFNWNVYDGLDTDAYAVDTGSAGAFTGCIAYMGYPIFFKEDHIYKVYGTLPSNFEVMGSATLGLAAGAGRSLAVAGETLFYLSRSGVMAYTGGLPQPMGAAFGTDKFCNGVGGSDGLKYYISMENEQGGWGLYVYDTQRGLWHREDETRATHFARHRGRLHFLNDRGELWIAGGLAEALEGATPEAEIRWMAEFADFAEEEPDKKGVGKIQIRLELDPGATVKVYLMFDSDGRWQQVSSALGEGAKRSYYLPVTPTRSDHYRLKLEGTGGCRIYSLAREYYVGSALRSKAGRN